MDFDINLSLIRGGLNKCKSLYAFEKLVSKEGNESAFDSIVEILNNILSSKEFTFDSIRRNVCFYLILNSDLEILKELVEIDDIGYLLWNTPTLSKSLLIYVIWGLDLNRFYCEAIGYTCPKMSAALVEIVAENIKYCKTERTIKIVNHVVSSAYRSILRIPLNRITCHDKNIFLNKMFNNILLLLKCFGDPPDDDHMKKMTQRQLYLHAGRTIYNLLQMAKDCIELFVHKNVKAPVEKDFKMYLITFDESYKKGPSETVVADDLVTKSIVKINYLLVDMLKRNIMAINVDVYCSWCEFKESEESSKNLQLAIGELAHNLLDLMKEEGSFDGELISMLPAIAICPENLNDKIGKADRETILSNASQSSEDQGRWLEALVSKPYMTLDVACIDCVLHNCHLLNDETFKYLIMTGVELLRKKEPTVLVDNIKQLTLKCLHNIKDDERSILIMEIFKHSLDDDTFELPNLDSRLTECLNKIIDLTDEIMSVLIIFFIENPCKFYNAVITKAIKSPQQTDVLIDGIVRLKGYYKTDKFISLGDRNDSDNKHMPFIFSHIVRNFNVNHKSEQERLDFTVFLEKIAKANLLNYECIFYDILLENFANYFDNKNPEVLLTYLEAMERLSLENNLQGELALLLSEMGVLLEYVRWDIYKYSSAAVQCVQVILNMQTLFMEKFIITRKSTDIDYIWLCNNLSHLSPINYHYYQKLWPSKEYKDLYKYERNTVSLCSLLSRTVSQEWKAIFKIICYNMDPISSFGMMCDSVKDLAKAIKSSGNINSLLWLEYCCNNLNIILQIILRELSPVEIDSCSMYLIVRLIQVLNSLPDSVQFQCFSHLLVSLSVLVRIPPLQTVNAKEEIEQMANILNTIEDPESKETLKMVLMNKNI